MKDYKAKKERLDLLLVERGLCTSREQAQVRILSGEVWTREERLDKAGNKYPADIPLEIRSTQLEFSSRGGYKLEHALKAFQISVSKRVCIDIGASTGGFTDCLLKTGAEKVYAVDVGYGQLDQKLRNDPRVVNLEKTNARYLELPNAHEITLLVADVSFISLLKVVEPLTTLLPQCTDWILLFKPQFEVGPEHLGKGGVVKNPEVTKIALDEFDQSMKQLGFIRPGRVEESPIVGKKSGNIEYLLHYTPKKLMKDNT